MRYKVLLFRWLSDNAGWIVDLNVLYRLVQLLALLTFLDLRSAVCLRVDLTLKLRATALASCI